MLDPETIIALAGASGGALGLLGQKFVPALWRNRRLRKAAGAAVDAYLEVDAEPAAEDPAAPAHVELPPVPPESAAFAQAVNLQLTSLMNQLRFTDERVAKLEAERAAEQARRAELEVELAALRAENARLAHVGVENVQLRARIAELEAELAVLRAAAEDCPHGG